MKVGDKVRVISYRNQISEITEMKYEDKAVFCRCLVNGLNLYWFHVSELELVEEQQPIKYNYITPDHYQTDTKEVWEMMIDIYGKDKFKTFCELNIFKYRMRLGKKPNEETQRELEKIRWYEDKLKNIS